MAEEEEPYVFELGDTVIIKSKYYGTVRGKVYYRDPDLIRILPEDAGNRLYNYALIDGEFDPALKVRRYMYESKAVVDGFVQQQDLHAGQVIETFSEEGEPTGEYTIEEVDVENDRITIKDATDAVIPVDFNYYGIPLDLPFAIIRAREPPAEDEENDEEEDEEEGATIRVAEDSALEGDLERQVEDEADARVELPADAVAADLERKTAARAALESVVAGDPEEFDIEFTGYITLPAREQAVLIPEAQRVYPDNIQKADALQDFTTFLTAKEQQDMKQLRRIRALTESVFTLKNQLIEYNPDNSFKRMYPQSANYLSELLKLANVPLARPVLDVSLKVYNRVNPDRDEEEQWVVNGTVEASTRKKAKKAYEKARRSKKTDAEIQQELAEIEAEDREAAIEYETERNTLNVVEFVNELRQANEYLSGAGSSGIIKHWIHEAGYHERYDRPWRPLGEATEDNAWQAKTDSEFFRSEIPDLTVAQVDALTMANASEPATMKIGKTHFSLRRALGATFKPNHNGGGKESYIKPEYAANKNDMLFPLKYRNYLGAIRSGLIVEDSYASKVRQKYMEQILAHEGDIEDVPRGNGIITIGIGGNTLGNIKLADFIGILEVHGYGPAEIIRRLSHYGMEQLEINVEVGETIRGKITNYINATKAYIKELRDKLETQRAGANESKPDVMTEDIVNWLINDVIGSEPILAGLKQELTKQSPRLAKSDYAMLSYIYKEAGNLLLAAAGGNPDELANQRRIATRAIYLRALQAGVAKQRLIREHGEQPRVNPCKHVKLLETINSIEDDATRLGHLAKFIVKYRGDREENWIKCSVCSRDLVCVHRMLEIQQFMHAREREMIKKEMYLNFCGPLMGKFYQCRNCGQALEELDFDNNMQFDDNGRPMTSYAVLEDIQKKENDLIDKMLGAETDLSSADDVINKIMGKKETKTTIKDYGSETKNSIFRIIKVIANKLGISPIADDYDRMIEQVQNVVNDLPSRERFAKEQKRLAKELGKKPKRLPDYDVILQRTTVVAAGAYLLIHIQSHIPDYMIQTTIPLCKRPGFTGFPFGVREDLTGVEYMACAIASITQNEIPWNMTGFQDLEEGKRLKTIVSGLMDILDPSSENSEIQQMFALKRKYLRDTFGAERGEGRPTDQISPFFLPAQKNIDAVTASKAGTVIIPEVTAASTVVARSDIWIQAANQIAAEEARNSGDVIIGSPYLEATTTYSPINKPREFWSDKRLPELPKRTLQRATLATALSVPFKPRPLADILPPPPENLFYVLFLNVCFQGDRYGLPHEPGFNNMCPHCEFQFPTSRILMDNEKEGLNALQSQQVEINRDTFTSLLDATHERYSVVPYKRPALPAPFDLMRTVALIEPPPLPEWKAIMEETIQGLGELPPGASKTQIQEALSPIAETASNAAEAIQGRLTKPTLETIKMIFKLAPNEIGEVLLTYLIVPLNRLITNMELEPLNRLQPALIEELSEQHVTDIVSHILAPNIDLTKRFQSDFEPGRSPFARAKIELAVQQLAQIPPLLEKVNSSNIPGGKRALHYLIQALILPPLASMMDPNEIPDDEFAQSASDAVRDNSVRLLYQLVTTAFAKFRKERLSYSDKEIKEKLQVRAEQEKVKIIEEIKAMSDDRKRIEMLYKKFGLEKYSLSGTKDVYRYNPERYDIERTERADAGINDFATDGFGPEGEPVPELYGGDENGIFDFGPQVEVGYDIGGNNEYDDEVEYGGDDY
jgi:hypothetical protein